jgi:hypothetical protein
MLFLNTSGFQNQMNYDPVAFINIIFAGIFASSVSGLVWAMVAPDTPRKQRLRFTRVAKKAMRQLFDGGHGAAGLASFERNVGGALIRLERELRLDRPQDQACMAAAMALLAAGRESILCSPSRTGMTPLCDGSAGSGSRAASSRYSPKGVAVAMNNCILMLSRDNVGTDGLVRAVEDLASMVDEFRGQNSYTTSGRKVNADAC